MANLTNQIQRDKLCKKLDELVCFPDILDDLLDAVADNCEPEEVFDEAVLRDWAKNNGFVVDPDEDSD